MIRFGKQVIQNKACCLISDHVVSEAPEGTTLIQKYQSWSITCSTEELHRIRAENTNVPVYGLWQILIASGFLQRFSDGRLYGIYFNAAKTEGQIFSIKNDTFFLTETKFYQSSAAEIVEVEIDTDALVLPDEPVITATERMAYAAQTRRTKIIWFATITAATAFSFIFSNDITERNTAARQAAIASLVEENAAIRHKIDVEKPAFQYEYQDYIAQLAPIIRLLADGSDIVTPKLLFGTYPYRVLVKQREVARKPFADTTTFQKKYLIDGSTDVYWTN